MPKILGREHGRGVYLTSTSPGRSAKSRVIVIWAGRAFLRQRRHGGLDAISEVCFHQQTDVEENCDGGGPASCTHGPTRRRRF